MCPRQQGKKCVMFANLYCASASIFNKAMAAAESKFCRHSGFKVTQHATAAHELCPQKAVQ
jgi:hypothetical protein